MTLKDTHALMEEAVHIVRQERKIVEQSVGAYAKMKYPKVIPMFRFQVHSYQIEDYGSLFTMESK